MRCTVPSRAASRYVAYRLSRCSSRVWPYLPTPCSVRIWSRSFWRRQRSQAATIQIGSGILVGAAALWCKPSYAQAEVKIKAEDQAHQFPAARRPIKGAVWELHEGTVVRLQTGDYIDELATVRLYDAATGKWQVQLINTPATTTWVGEDEIGFGYCLLPENVNRTMSQYELLITNVHGKERGLVAAQPIKKDELIFFDFPCMLTATGGSDHMYHMRWRAYLNMQMEAATDDDYALLLDVFEQQAIDAPLKNLDSADDIIKSGWSRRLLKAREIVEAALGTTGNAERVSSEMMAKEVTQVAEVFARFESNHFKFNVSSPPPRAAVYAYSSLLNHSCDPTVTVHPVHDALYVRACKDIEPGTELTFNYSTGEPEMSSALDKRRRHVMEKHGFVCLCEQCAVEASAQH